VNLIIVAFHAAADIRGLAPPCWSLSSPPRTYVPSWSPLPDVLLVLATQVYGFFSSFVGLEDVAFCSDLVLIAPSVLVVPFDG
jgi:hypothetical protein